MKKKAKYPDNTIRVLEYLNTQYHLTIWKVREALGVSLYLPQTKRLKKLNAQQWRSSKQIETEILKAIKKLKAKK